MGGDISSRKTVFKNIRFTPEEMEDIKHKAETLKMTTSRYIHTMALEGEIYMLEAPEYRDVMVALGRIGNNINQITRRLNETGSFYYDDVADVKKEFDEICLMLSQYQSTLRLKKL